MFFAELEKYTNASFIIFDRLRTIVRLTKIVEEFYIRIDEPCYTKIGVKGKVVSQI